MRRGSGIPTRIVLAVASETENPRAKIAHELKETFVRRFGCAQRIFGDSSPRLGSASAKGSDSLPCGRNLQAESDKVFRDPSAELLGLNRNGCERRLRARNQTPRNGA